MKSTWKKRITTYIIIRNVSCSNDFGITKLWSSLQYWNMLTLKYKVTFRSLMLSVFGYILFLNSLLQLLFIIYNAATWYLNNANSSV